MITESIYARPDPLIQLRFGVVLSSEALGILERLIEPVTSSLRAAMTRTLRRVTGKGFLTHSLESIRLVSWLFLGAGLGCAIVEICSFIISNKGTGPTLAEFLHWLGIALPRSNYNNYEVIIELLLSTSIVIISCVILIAFWFLLSMIVLFAIFNNCSHFKLSLYRHTDLVKILLTNKVADRDAQKQYIIVAYDRLDGLYSRHIER